jgi:Co/Zn/Cd efflux system component
VRDTGAILLDMNPDQGLAARLRQTVEAEGDSVADLHLWRLGPGHLGAIVSVASARAEASEFYRQKLGGGAISHLTIEVVQPAAPAQV